MGQNWKIYCNLKPQGLVYKTILANPAIQADREHLIHNYFILCYKNLIKWIGETVMDSNGLNYHGNAKVTVTGQNHL